MYVDDMLIIGKRAQMQESATMIQKEFSVKIQHNLADYLGCEFHMNNEKTKRWLGQPSIIKSLEQKFGERAMKEKIINDTWVTKIHCQKIGKQRRQCKCRAS